MSLYNSIIIAWSLSYLGHSFNHPLPWNQRPLLKNISVTGEQREREGRQSRGRQRHHGARDRECESKRRKGRGEQAPGKAVLSAWVPADLSCLQTMSHQYFWYHSILYASGHIDEGIQDLALKLTLGIFAAWSLLALTMITGLKLSMPVSHPDRRRHLHVTRDPWAPGPNTT